MKINFLTTVLIAVAPMNSFASDPCKAVLDHIGNRGATFNITQRQGIIGKVKFENPKFQDGVTNFGLHISFQKGIPKKETLPHAYITSEWGQCFLVVMINSERGAPQRIAFSNSELQLYSGEVLPESLLTKQIKPGRY